MVIYFLTTLSLGFISLLCSVECLICCLCSPFKTVLVFNICYIDKVGLDIQLTLTYYTERTKHNMRIGRTCNTCPWKAFRITYVCVKKGYMVYAVCTRGKRGEFF